MLFPSTIGFPYDEDHRNYENSKNHTGALIISLESKLRSENYINENT